MSSAATASAAKKSSRAQAGNLRTRRDGMSRKVDPRVRVTAPRTMCGRREISIAVFGKKSKRDAAGKRPGGCGRGGSLGRSRNGWDKGIGAKLFLRTGDHVRKPARIKRASK